MLTGSATAVNSLPGSVQPGVVSKSLSGQQQYREQVSSPPDINIVHKKSKKIKKTSGIKKQD